MGLRDHFGAVNARLYGREFPAQEYADMIGATLDVTVGLLREQGAVETESGWHFEEDEVHVLGTFPRCDEPGGSPH